MPVTITTAALAILSGTLVGFSLGLIGGGGSILATPLLYYLVRVGSPHIAIGTGALAVSLNAFACFTGHVREGNVRWRPAITFAVIGTAGALLGSSLGQRFDGQRLLFLFGLLMVAVAVSMIRSCNDPSREERTPDATASTLTGALALGTGTLAGFFGIGGGFLIVPGLMAATRMPMINAIGSSLLAVGAFGLATAVNYAAAGLVDWPVAGEFIGGGFVGGLAGMKLAGRLCTRKDTLKRLFAALVLLVATYVLARSAQVL